MNSKCSAHDPRLDPETEGNCYKGDLKRDCVGGNNVTFPESDNSPVIMNEKVFFLGNYVLKYLEVKGHIYN